MVDSEREPHGSLAAAAYVPGCEEAARPGCAPSLRRARFGDDLAHPRAGHVAIASFAGRQQTLTGSCEIVGTPGADVIEETSAWGDVILGFAGNDQIHANDCHTDRVNCGPGSDTVWADRTDRLTGCEIIHR